jgi:hypothetical protein
MSWGLGDTNVDPGEVLLRLVTQSAARAERYAMLLEEAYEAAERLKQAHDAGAQIEAPGDELADTAETARRDLDRIFNTGGVAALVGNTYGAAKDVGVYVTGEAIRGLADLEAKERERCANFATKAIAAGLAERTVRVAERQGQRTDRPSHRSLKRPNDWPVHNAQLRKPTRLRAPDSAARLTGERRSGCSQRDRAQGAPRRVGFSPMAMR